MLRPSCGPWAVVRLLDQTEERRPRQGAASNLNLTAQFSDLAARARRHDHGVLVLSERKDGTVVSQVYSNLPAAETKVWRTRERGLSASLVLVRIVPVPHVHLDEAQDGGVR